MTAGQPAGTLKPDVERVLQATLRHLALEEEFLAAALTVLQQARLALIQADSYALTQALDQQSEQAEASEVMQRKRQQFRQDAAALLDLPVESITLSVLASRLPAHARQPLADYHTRLRQLAAAVEEMSRGNAAILRSCLKFLQQVLAGLTGGAPRGGHRYGPAGLHQELGCGSLVSARG